MFHRFYRAEAARLTPGNGLGLSLVAAIANLHGAAVAIRNRVGSGCEAELRFPIGDPGGTPLLSR